MLSKEEKIIVSTIADLVGLPDNFFNSKNRKLEYVFGRQLFAKQLRKKKYSFHEIGAKIGKDHSTAIYLIHKYKPPMHLAKLERKILNEIDRRLNLAEYDFYVKKAEEFVNEVFTDGSITKERMIFKLSNYLKKIY
jgi:hypothetical protein